MKKIVLLGSLIVGSLMVKTADAQVSVNVNIGTQPAWGPYGYDYAEYYYMPDIEAYYWVPRRQFVYFDAGNWVFSASLPNRCRNYDLYSGYKVVINEPRPWMRFNDHRSRYAPFCHRHDQIIIRDGRGRWGNGRPYYEERGRGRDRDWDDDRYDRRGHGNGNGHGRRW